MCPNVLSSPSSSRQSLQPVNLEFAGDHIPLGGDLPRHFPRGLVLSGCLHGEAYIDSLPVYTDLTPGEDGEIKYDPESDYRLDKFDGLEYHVARAARDAGKSEEKTAPSTSEEKQ